MIQRFGTMGIVESEHSRMAWSRLAKTDPQARYMREATEIGRKSPGALKKSAFARLGINEVTTVIREGCQIAPAAIPRKTSARESQSVRGRAHSSSRLHPSQPQAV